ncbi:MAG TPA: zf-HC2 domain-containing protein [Methylomirabilota bacterium]|nr:zf-HC2 domain-containing protein [Methylomirabilota bacterium]
MDCAAVKPRMEALVSGSLPPSERSLAEQHISTCEGCRLELELVRAIGSQEKAPAVGKDDWTLDRIFGSEGSHGGGPQGASPPSQRGAGDPGEDAGPGESAPGSPSVAGFPAIFPTANSDPPSTPTASPEPAEANAQTRSIAGEEEGKASGESGSWDFEPADAKSHIKPPAESLFFATEALTRGKDDKKASNLRVILWGAGGLVGAGLLAFSAWFVLHGPSTDSGDVPAGSEAPGPGTVPPPANNGGATPNPDAPDNSAHNAPTAREPGVAASSAVPQSPPPLGTGTAAPANHAPPAPAPGKPAPATLSPQSQKAPPSANTQGSNPRVTTTPPKPAPLAPLNSEATEHRVAGEPVRPTQRPYTPPPDDGPDSDESHVSARTAPAPETSRRASQGVDETTFRPTQASPAPEAPKSAPAKSSSPSGATEKPQAVEINAPIDRLHLATVEAEERGDMVALRRLRSSWKSFMVKIIGPDRARAKREYADCLWAIQDLTGRRSDQRDALAAYREYLLGAPAGGADSRSVSRLRQLEDAIAEHH